MLLLASASPARRRLLEQAAIPHGVQVSGVDETAIRNNDPLLLALELARAKAEAVRGDCVAGDPWTAMLGCDSLLVVDGEVFGKPADPEEARHRWRRMAGRSGELVTGHCLLRPVAAGREGMGERLEAVTTRVHFAPLDAAEIEAYVATGEPLACAGGFALEGRGGLLVERIEGCYSNVIGLSLPLLRRWLVS
ncbi:Maf family nucleotide pyrophosphatase [Cyanobium sp. FGCU-6]|jgi:septum formation protein|nr:Maf family nucleotide pyrophosphatase [Cyanobium sp. FGCU6]